MHKVVCFGEVMLKLSPKGQARFRQAGSFDIGYAGAEANVASALAGWGYHTVQVTRFPDHDIGHAAAASLSAYGVDTSCVSFGAGRIGIFFVEKGASLRSSAVLYDRLPSAFSELRPGDIDWAGVLQNASWFHWTGISPALSQGVADLLNEALEECSRRQITVSGDINFRVGQWQYGKQPHEIMGRLMSLTDHVIGGENDLKKIFGLEPEPGEGSAFDRTARTFQNRFPRLKSVRSVDRVMMSASQNSLQGMCWIGGQIVSSTVYDIPNIVDRIGSGDAFAAGCIYGSLMGWPENETIEFSTAAAALKHTIEGDVLLASPEEIRQLMQGDRGGRVRR